MRRFLLLCMFLALCGGTVFSVDVGDVIRRAEEPFTLDRVFSVSEMSTYRGDSLDRTMELESYTLTSDGVTKSLVVYTDPIRMRGTAYLTIGNDLWVRFGSTGRVRKLSSSAKTGSAGGSDFSYEDLGEDSGGIS